MKHIMVDVCIIGAGSAGMGAFYALKDSIYTVALIEKNLGVGGTAVQGWVNSWIPGGTPPYLRKICSKLGYSTEQVNRSLLPSQFAKPGTENRSLLLQPGKLQEVYEVDIASASNVSLFKEYEFVKADFSRRNVSSILIENKRIKEKVEIVAKCFIDSSGDGVLATYQGTLGVDFLQGVDSSTLFNESLAPKTGNIEYLNEPSLFFKVGKNTVSQSEYNTIEKRFRISPSEEFLYNGYIGSNSTVNPMTGVNLSGFGVIELGVDRARYLSMEATSSYWSFIQKEVEDRITHHKPTYGFRNNVCSLFLTGEFAPILGIREGRRVVCDYMLTQNDLTKTITPSTIGKCIAYGSHIIDLHVYGNINPVNVSKFNNTELRPSGIPYQSLIPKRFDNVMVACRAYGASHIALAARRVNKDMAQLGWAAGNASKWCLDNGMIEINYRQVDVASLQSAKYTDFAKDVDFMVTNILNSKYI